MRQEIGDVWKDRRSGRHVRVLEVAYEHVKIRACDPFGVVLRRGRKLTSQIDIFGKRFMRVGESVQWPAGNS